MKISRVKCQSLTLIIVSLTLNRKKFKGRNLKKQAWLFANLVVEAELWDWTDWTLDRGQGWIQTRMDQ